MNGLPPPSYNGQYTENSAKKIEQGDPAIEQEDRPLVYRIGDATPIHLTLFFAMQVSYHKGPQKVCPVMAVHVLFHTVFFFQQPLCSLQHVLFYCFFSSNAVVFAARLILLRIFRKRCCLCSTSYFIPFFSKRCCL